MNKGDYVLIVKDNNPDGRYDGKKGKLIDSHEEELGDGDKQMVYVVDVDINSGDTGTCIAREVRKLG